MRKKIIVVMIFIFSIYISADVPSLINYRGKLNDSGSPANGTYTFIFKIYDADSAGNLLWDTTANSLDLPVNNGLYSYALGSTNVINPDIFTNQNLYLEVNVNGSTLSPREQLVTSPYAFQAYRIVGNNRFGSTGNVGIGISNPVNKLDISLGSGSGNLVGFYALNQLRLNISANGSDSDILSQNGNNLRFGTAFSGIGMTMLNANGYVGIGTTSPSARLSVTNNIASGRTVDFKEDSGGVFVMTNGKVGIGTTSPNSTLEVFGSLTLRVTNISATYTASDSDYAIIADASTSSFAVNLPPASGRKGRIYAIKRKGASGNTVTIQPNGSEKIDTFTSLVLQSTTPKTVTIICDGSNWFILSYY